MFSHSAFVTTLATTARFPMRERRPLWGRPVFCQSSCRGPNSIIRRRWPPIMAWAAVSLLLVARRAPPYDAGNQRHLSMIPSSTFPLGQADAPRPSASSTKLTLLHHGADGHCRGMGIQFTRAWRREGYIRGSNRVQRLPATPLLTCLTRAIACNIRSMVGVIITKVFGSIGRHDLARQHLASIAAGREVCLRRSPFGGQYACCVSQVSGGFGCIDGNSYGRNLTGSVPPALGDARRHFMASSHLAARSWDLCPTLDFDSPSLAR